MQNQFPLVSVCITAYNIDQYIEECVESILRQKVSFNYEIVIGEDCSLDNTKSILESYNIRYPDLFKIVYNEKNIGMMNNFHKTLNRCKGKFIAIMDGDDIWLDESKLQKQIQYLIQNEDFVLSFHDAYISDSKLNLVTSYSKRFPDRYSIFLSNLNYSLDDIIKWRGILGATSSIVFKNPFEKFPDWIKNGLYGLEPMIFILLHPYGKYKYFEDKMSIYRVHNSSTDRSYAQINKAFRDIIELEVYQKYLDSRFRFYFQKKIIKLTLYVCYKSVIKLSIKDFFKSISIMMKQLYMILFYFFRK